MEARPRVNIIRRARARENNFREARTREYVTKEARTRRSWKPRWDNLHGRGRVTVV
jgi:hypothetical protein